MQPEQSSNQIPEQYKELFELEWQNGNNCKLNYEKRLELHSLWLQYNRNELKGIIDKLNHEGEIEDIEN